MKPIIFNPAASDQERREFTEWLFRNKLTLAKYDSDELAHLGVTCGFSLTVICDVLSHWITDRKDHNTYPIRQAWYVDRELAGSNLGIGLSDSWRDLGSYLMYGKEF